MMLLDLTKCRWASFLFVYNRHINILCRVSLLLRMSRCLLCYHTLVSACPWYCSSVVSNFVITYIVICAMMHVSTYTHSFSAYFYLIASVLLSFFFFFSSRRRHTRFDCDWSSDVCSSDLASPTSPTLPADSTRGARPVSPRNTNEALCHSRLLSRLGAVAAVGTDSAGADDRRDRKSVV